MAEKKIVPPPPKRGLTQRLAVAPPPPTMAPDNLSIPTESVQDLNFKVSSSFHREFKMTAVIRGMSMKELLEASFRCWQDTHDDRTGRRGNGHDGQG